MAKKKVNKKAADKSSTAHGADFASQAAAAKYAGVDVRTVQRWKAKGMPVIDLGGNRVGYTKAMLDKFKSMGESDSQSAELKAEIIRLKKVNRELKEMDRDERKGELIPAEQVEREQIDRILAVKRALLGWPRKMPARLKGRTMTQMANIIRDEVYYVKDVFSGKKLKRKK